MCVNELMNKMGQFDHVDYDVSEDLEERVEH